MHGININIIVGLYYMHVFLMHTVETITLAPINFFLCCKLIYFNNRRLKCKSENSHLVHNYLAIYILKVNDFLFLLLILVLTTVLK